MPTDDEDYASAVKRPPDRVTYPGIPARNLPLRPRVPLEAPEFDLTPVEPVVARAREKTLHGLGTPPPPSRREPTSNPPIALPDGTQVNRKTLRLLWMWIGPIVITLVTSGYGYVKAYALGFAKGYHDASSEMAELRGKVESLATTVSSSTAGVRQSFENLQQAVNHDGVLYNDHDARVTRAEKSIENITIRLDALSKQKSLIVKYSK